ncbi:cation transporter [Microcoleus sp. Pol1B3]
MADRHNALNIRGAFLHLIADAAVSLGAVLANIAIVATGWLWFDPIISLIIVVVIVLGTWQWFQESLNLTLFCHSGKIKIRAKFLTVDIASI